MQILTLNSTPGKKVWQSFVARQTGASDPNLVRRDALTKKVFGKPVSAREAVSQIIDHISKKGDQAIKRYSHLLDGVPKSKSAFVVTDKERKEAEKAVSSQLKSALKEACDHIKQYHQSQLHQKYANVNRPGVKLSERRSPLDRVGIYVPGGKAPLVSTVLMTALPAKVAGVKEVVMATPANKEGEILPAVLVAANLVGVHKIFKIGGAQAIGAFAFGTETVPKVDKIVGPANIFGTEAKRQVVGTVGIDSFAGPSEILIIADPSANPEHLAWDLLAQGEHGSGAVALLLSASEKVIKETVAKAKAIVKTYPDLQEAFKSTVAFKVKSLEEAAAYANDYAPEHLSLQVRSPRQYVNKIQRAGAAFLGSPTAQAMGDYTAGPNHVLPTNKTVCWSSPLSVRDFERYTSIIEYLPHGMIQEGPAAVAIAEAEGLHAHAESIRQRMKS